MSDISNSIIDLRSDTVTRPTPAMREAMTRAEVGDDVYGDDPTVRALEDKAAGLLGKEDALFVSSGTQSNLLALLTHCGRGDEYIGGVDYHISGHEQGGAAVLGGISPRHLVPDADGCLNPQDVAANIQDDDPHFAVSKLVCLENTFHGRVVPQERMEAVADVTHAGGLMVHLDGARLMNAAVRSGLSPAELTRKIDTVSVCLSKGLGAPVGSVLVGPSPFIQKARRHRKLVGGAMRQAGILAACGIHALDHHIERLGQDHDNAGALCGRLAMIDGLEVNSERLDTNMVWVDVPEQGRPPLAGHMRDRGIVLSNPYGAKGTVRLVTHLDFEADHIDRVVDGFASWMKA